MSTRKKPAKSIMYRGAKYVRAALDREDKRRMLGQALSNISEAQDECSEVLEAGESASAMESALDHLYEAHKLVSDAIPRGR